MKKKLAKYQNEYMIFLVELIITYSINKEKTLFILLRSTPFLLLLNNFFLSNLNEKVDLVANSKEIFF